MSNKIKTTLKTIAEYALAPYHLDGFIYDKIIKAGKQYTSFKQTISNLSSAISSVILSFSHIYLASKILPEETDKEYILPILITASIIPFVTNTFSRSNVENDIKEREKIKSKLEEKLCSEYSPFESKPQFLEERPYHEKEYPDKSKKANSILKHEAISKTELEKLEKEDKIMKGHSLKEIMENPENFFKL